jgi:hypothetical protein
MNREYKDTGDTIVAAFCFVESRGYGILLEGKLAVRN